MKHLRDIEINSVLAVILAIGLYAVSFIAGCAVTEVEYQILVDREFAVQPMLETSVFRSGEKFRLRLKPRQGSYVYLLNRGTSGNYIVLFPRSEINDGSNFIPAGESVMIPDEGSYQFDERTGLEEVILCAYPESCPQLEQLARAGFRDTASVDSLLVKLQQANRQSSSLVKTLDRDSTRVCLVAGRSAAVLVSRIILQHQPAASPASQPAPRQTNALPSPPAPQVKPADRTAEARGTQADLQGRALIPSSPSRTPDRSGPQAQVTPPEQPAPEPHRAQRPSKPDALAAIPARPQAPEQRTNWTLVEAVRQGLVEVSSTGNGLSSVHLRVKRLHKPGLRVEVPPGTYFASRGRAQSMITTALQSLDLNTQESIEVELPAACADFNRPQPDTDSSFDVRHLENPVLRRLLEVIARRSVPQAVAQVAIWVLTDDVSRDELNSVYRVTRYVNGIPIGEGPAASDEQIGEAKKLLEEAGVDTSQTRLFH